MVGFISATCNNYYFINSNYLNLNVAIKTRSAGKVVSEKGT